MPTPFEQELVTCIPELQRYAHKLTGERAAADDLVQDCMERALRNEDKFQPGTNLEAWLMTILKNLFFTERRRARRCLHVALVEQDVPLPAPQITRIALAETEEAIRALPARQRGLITLVAIDGLSYRDAAQRLGVPVGTIRSRLSRVRDQIRSNMEHRRQVVQVRRPAPTPVRAAPAPHGAVPAATPTPAPAARRQRPSALPACVARLRRPALPGDAHVPVPVPAATWGPPFRVPVRETNSGRGPPRRRRCRIHACTTRSAPAPGQP